MQSKKINKLMCAGVMGVTVLGSASSAFAQENGRNGIFSNNNGQPNQYYQYYQNFFPQMNWGRGNQNPQNNNQNNYNHNNQNYRDYNYLNNCNNEQYAERDDANVNLDIKRDGSVIIRSAVVNSISGNNITLTSTLGNANLTWTLVIDNNTRFESRNGRQINLREVAVGDKVTAKGKLMSGSSLTVRADLVRDTMRTVRR